LEARKGHCQSCKACKEVIYQVLADAFGPDAIVQQHRLHLPSTLQGYEEHPYFAALAAIESALKAYRGFTRLVSQRELPPVDFFVKSVGLIVEVDETQHFTTPRAMTLEQYPEALPVGFHRERWLQLCAALNRHDNSPPYRDEQRAWLDTLRDFAPVHLGMQPVVRLYAGAAVWCRLDLRKGVEAMQPYAPHLAQALGATRYGTAVDRPPAGAGSGR
jgi:hypothetical protein